MNRIWRGLLQIISYGIFFSVVGYLSNSPTYQRYSNDQAMIKLSFQHAGKIVGECRDRDAKEMAQLPENMRIVKVCPRERSPLELSLLIDDELIYSETLPPRGLRNDGMSSVYVRIPIQAGNMRLQVKMKDHIEQSEYPYQLERQITIDRAQVLVVDFDSQEGQFTIL